MNRRNAKRIKRMAEAVSLYRHVLGDEFATTETIITDMLTDLRHYCDRHHIDINQKLFQSAEHFRAEGGG